MKIQLLNKIAKIGLDVFNPAEYECSADFATADAIMVRSAALHDMEFDADLRAIARCGAGVNNIPVDRCTEAGIVVFNTPGANANGVKELAIAALVLASRDVVGGINWAATLGDQPDVAKAVEAGKSAYVGHELRGKTLGVIGLGAIGGMVANAGVALGMKVIGCDPYISTVGAWNLSPAVKSAASYEDIYKQCDYISIHVPATPQTKKMICEKSINMMKDGVRIINLARADLVSADDIKAALVSGKVASYVTDFPTNETVGAKGIINIPHLGASTYESEDNCAVMAAEELCDFLENGNIRNSVNFPAVSLPRSGAARVCVAHKNAPGMLNQITAAAAALNINIDKMTNGSHGDVAYTILDVENADGLVDAIVKIDGVINARNF